MHTLEKQVLLLMEDCSRLDKCYAMGLSPTVYLKKTIWIPCLLYNSKS